MRISIRSGGTPISDNAILCEKQVGSQPGHAESEFAKSPVNSFGVFQVDADPNVQVVGSPDMAVDADRVAADQQIVNARSS